MLMMSLAPIIAAFSAWVFLGEGLSTWQMSGIALTIGGLIWVILENNYHRDLENPHYLKGGAVRLGRGNRPGSGIGAGQERAGRGILSAVGERDPDGTAVVLMWLVTLGQRRAGSTIRAVIENRKALRFIVGGAFVGPFIGVSFSLLALQYANVGVASTLMALSPIFYCR